MLKSIALLATLTFASPVAAQAPAPPAIRTFAGSAEVRTMIARAAAKIKPGDPIVVQPLLAFDTYRTNLEYRVAATGSAIHKDQAEIFYVLEGAGTLVEGGALVGSKPADPQNDLGTAISGGTPRRVAAGDVFVILPGTPHWFNRVEGKLVMIVLKVPRGTP